MSRCIIFSLAGCKKISNHIFEEGALRILTTIRYDINYKYKFEFTKQNVKKRRLNQTMCENIVVLRNNRRK